VKVRFLIDENLTPRLKAAVQRHDAEISILRVGDVGAPPLGTPDPKILDYLEATQRLLVTDNRRSIPSHVAHHAATGKHHWGIIWVRPEARLGPLAESLYLIWAVNEAGEWWDRTEWLPF